MHFGDLSGPRLILVATDLNERRPVLYGEEASQSVLEGLLASTALPPWIRPLQVLLPLGDAGVPCSEALQ